MAVRNVSRIQRKLAVLITFSFLAVTLGCRGFFVNPVLQSVTVGPSNLNLQQGTTQQMTATGNFDDGSTKTLTSGVVWSSSDATIAPVSAAGVVNGAAAGTATITAEDGTVSGQATVNQLSRTAQVDAAHARDGYCEWGNRYIYCHGYRFRAEPAN